MKKLTSIVLMAILFSSLFFALSVKPASASSGTNQIYWGAFVGPSHIGTLAQLQAFESSVGKGVAIWSIFQYWDRPKDSENDPNFYTAWMDQCRAHGAIPEIAFDPGYGSGGDTTDYLAPILTGHYDNYLINWARNASAWGHPLFIRLFHEIDYSWNTSKETEFIQAYKYVVDLFRKYGANNVSWIWSGPSYMFIDDATARAIYPGDNYVDWAGLAGYAWSDSSFGSMFSSQYARSRSITDKPMMIVEIGYIGNNKDAWWGDVISNQLPNNYPQIKALVVWEMDNINVDVPSFKTAISSNLYTSNVYSSLNTSPAAAIEENPNTTNIPNTATTTSTPTSAPSGSVQSTPTPQTITSNTAVLLLITVSILILIGVPVSNALKKRHHRL